MNTQQQKTEIAAARVETSVLAGRKISRLADLPVRGVDDLLTFGQLREHLAVAGTATAPW